MQLPTFLGYCRKVWDNLPATAKHWARDQIVWPAVLTALLTIIPALLHKNIDWGLFRTALFLYTVVFLSYGLFQFIRAGWRTYQTQDSEIQGLQATVAAKTEEAKRAQDEIKSRLVLCEHHTELLERSEILIKEKNESLAELTRQVNQDAATINKLNEGIRQIHEGWNATERQLYEAKTQLVTERDRIIQPDVVLVWGWTEAQRMMRELNRDPDKDILVHNRSEQFIYNVQIEKVSLRDGLVFDPISDIPPDTLYRAVGRWNEKSSLTSNYAYFFVGGEEEAESKGLICKKTHNRGLSDSYYKIPMVVTYESRGIKWQWEFDFIYDVGGEETRFNKKSGKRLN